MARSLRAAGIPERRQFRLPDVSVDRVGRISAASLCGAAALVFGSLSSFDFRFSNFQFPISSQKVSRRPNSLKKQVHAAIGKDSALLEDAVALAHGLVRRGQARHGGMRADGTSEARQGRYPVAHRDSGGIGEGFLSQAAVLGAT